MMAYIKSDKTFTDTVDSKSDMPLYKWCRSKL